MFFLCSMNLLEIRIQVRLSELYRSLLLVVGEISAFLEEID